MDALRKLMASKQKEKGMSPMEKDAKMSVLNDLHKMASDAMADHMNGSMKKVTVASPDEEGLEHGLDKAKDLLHGMPEAMDDTHPDHENFAHTEEADDGEDGMSDYPDADDDHDLEADPMAEHEQDEHEEGEEEPDEHDCMSEEELNTKLAKLQSHLNKRKGRA
jgi:hypothetical protein